MNKLVGRVFRTLCVLFLMLPLSWAMAAGETEVPAEPGQAATLEKQLQDLQSPGSVYPQRARPGGVATPRGAWREREQGGLWGQII